MTDYPLVVQPKAKAQVVFLLCIHHRVSRYGQLYDFTIEDLQGSYYPLDPCLSVEMTYDVLRLTHGDPITIDTGSRITSIVPHTPINQTVVPLCQTCSGRLKESLGTLMCVSPDCQGRGRSRIYHFFQGMNIFRNPGDIVSFVDEALHGLHTEMTIANAISTLFSITSDDYTDARCSLKETLRTIKFAMSMANNRGEHIQELIIAEFINKLSIPTITFNDIIDTVALASSKGECQYVLSMIAELISERKVLGSDWFGMELEVIEEMLLIPDFPKERDVNHWI